MTTWLENQKCILTKENTRRKRFRLRKNNAADKTSDPIQSMSNSGIHNLQKGLIGEAAGFVRA